MEQPKQDYEEIHVSSEQIHWSKEDPSKLDLEYHDGIGSVRKAVLIGGVLTLVISLTIMVAQFGQPQGGIMILMYLPFLFIGIIGIMGGLGAGLAYTNVRALGKRGENSMIIVAFFSGFTTLMLLLPLLLNYQHMTPRQWLFLILTGTAAAGGQIFITKAYAKAPAKEISVYDFSIVIFAAIFGFLFLGQLPDVWSIIGYIIIIGTAVVKWRYSMKHHS